MIKKKSHTIIIIVVIIIIIIIVIRIRIITIIIIEKNKTIKSKVLNIMSPNIRSKKDNIETHLTKTRTILMTINNNIQMINKTIMLEIIIIQTIIKITLTNITLIAIIIKIEDSHNKVVVEGVEEVVVN